MSRKLNLKVVLASAAVAGAAMAVQSAAVRAITYTTYTWTGNGSDNNWSTTANWSGGTVPVSSDSSIVEFSGTVPNTTSNANSAYTLGKVEFVTPAAAYTLTGSTLSFADTTATSFISDNATSNQTIDNNLIVAPAGNGGYLSVGDSSTGSLTLAGTISTDATKPGSLFLHQSTGTGAVTVSGTLSGKFNWLTAGPYEGTSATTLVNLTGSNLTFNPSLIIVWTGTLELSNANALGLSNLIALNNGSNGAGNPTLLTNASMTVSSQINIESPTAMPTSPATLGISTVGGVGAYNSTFSGTIYMGNPYGTQASPRVDMPLDLTADSGGTVTISGNLLEPTYLNNVSINSNVTKIGAGTVILAGTGNNYLGTTEVKAGTLLVNGKLLTGGGAVIVDAGATLGGTGTIARGVAVSTGGTLSPGDAVGTFTLSSGLSLANGSNLGFTLGSPNVAGGTGGNDLVSTTALTLGTGVALSVTQGTGFGLGVYHLIDYTGALTDNSSGFSGWTVSGLSAGEIGVFSLGTDGSVNALNLTVGSSNIPEPATLGLLALGGLGLLLAKRRKMA